MNKVIDSEVGTTTGATITFPAKTNYTWEALQVSGTVDVAASVNLVDDIAGDNIVIWSWDSLGAVSFDFSFGDGNFFARKGKSLSFVITASTAACKIYASTQFH